MKWLLCLISLTACSWLPKTKNTEQESFSLSKIEFSTLADATPVNLEDYTKSNNIRWLTLYFSSKSCVSCTEKLHKVKDLLNQGIITDARFEFAAVSTDPAPLRQQVVDYASQNGFGFMKWLDDRGSYFKKYFLDGEVGVPFISFIADGKVLWSLDNQSVLTPDEIFKKIKETVPDTDPVPERDFTFYGEYGESKLSSLLREAEYTFVNVYSELCTSCFDELRLFSLPGHVFDLCQKPKCQILNLENGYPEEAPVEEHYSRMVQLLLDEGIPGKVILDPVSADDAHWRDRFYDGYCYERFPDWRGQFGVVLYSRSGEIVWDHKAGNAEAVKDKVKSL